MKRFAIAGLLAGLALSAVGPVLAQGSGAKTIQVATVGEPPTLDPMASTADLVGIVTQHAYETLYAFGDNWEIVPLIAADAPQISADGKVYTIPLRRNVKFHNGKAMTSADVVASLKRWMEVATRGKTTAGNVAFLEAPDGFTVRLTLKQPYAPLLALLSLNNSAAVIMPEGTPAQLGDVVGTGPYRVAERRPDQYLRMVRFEDYGAHDKPANGYGGKRTAALDEIRFVPVANPATRVEGSLSGQYHFADALPSDALPRLQNQANTKPVITKPFGWPVMVLNMKEGLLTNQKLREAVLTALDNEQIMLAGQGSPEFFDLNGSIYPQPFPWYTKVGAEKWNLGDPAKARTLAREAGYSGQPIRLLTSRQYEFHFKMAQLINAMLSQAGLKVEMMVVDWATLTQTRTKPGDWEMYITHSPFLPEPSLNGYMAQGTPGWWETPAKLAAVERFNTAVSQDERVKVWGDIQKLIYTEVPVVKLGEFNQLVAVSPKLEGYRPSPWPSFWNVTLKQ